YGSAELLNWLAYDQGIEPHIRVFDRPEPDDGTFCFLCALRSCANVIVRGPSRSKKQSSHADLQAMEGLYSPLGRTSSVRWVISGHESAAGDGIVVHRPHRRTVERADTSDRINNKSDLVFPQRCRRELCWNLLTRSPAFREYRVRRRGQSVDRLVVWRRGSANRQPCAC